MFSYLTIHYTLIYHYYYCVAHAIGDTLKLGSNTYLRFNHPEEASRLRESLIVSIRRPDSNIELLRVKN